MPVTHAPTVTAGLRWPPEMWPMAETMMPRARPVATATGSVPAPVSAAIVAAPAPMNTKTNVPMNSAASCS